jgi:hypothetical protein
MVRGLDGGVFAIFRTRVFPVNLLACFPAISQPADIRAKHHAAQALLNIVKTVDAVKGYIEKEFVPEVRRSFECPNCHCLSSHWIFYNTS